MAIGDVSTIQESIEVKKGESVASALLGVNILVTAFDILDTSLVETSRSGNTVFMNVIFTVIAKS